MKLDYAVSLWNYTHYTKAPSMERICAQLREQGYGIELWSTWNNELNLFDAVGRQRLKAALQGMPVSLHSAIEVNRFVDHKMQIDTAADIGAEVIVIHSDNICFPETKTMDTALANKVTQYAGDAGVKIALENGQLPFLKKAIEDVDGLGICLDTGHVYLTENPMWEFLDALKSKIIHLHIQEVLPPSEEELLGIHGIIYDHYTPGTGGIPAKDWDLLFSTLKATNFRGTAVFEIHPRSPLQTAFLGTQFINQRLLEISEKHK